MKAKLFKTKKLAQKYISENYPNAYNLRPVEISDSNLDQRDMPNLQFCGYCSALAVEDETLDTLDITAWWEEGDDKYELLVGGKLTGTFDNSYDAREAYDKAVEVEEYKDEEEEEVFEVKLLCNGEDISN